eukprot:219054_1
MSSSILMTFWMTARRPVMMLTLSYHYKISQVTTQSIMATRPLTDEKTILTLKIKQAYSQWSTQQINSKRDKIWTDICENLKTHSKRRIIIAKYDTHIADLDNRINARKAKLSKIWGGLNMIPANTVQNRDANPIPSKKMMLNHRRVLHPRVRFATNDEDNAQEDGDVDYESLLSELELEFYERIDRICDERDGEYLALMMCGSKRWVMLDESDAKVKEYLSRRNALPPSAFTMPEVTNVHEWNLSPWIPANQKRNEKVREEDDA